MIPDLPHVGRERVSGDLRPALRPAGRAGSASHVGVVAFRDCRECSGSDLVGGGNCHRLARTYQSWWLKRLASVAGPTWSSTWRFWEV